MRRFVAALILGLVLAGVSGGAPSPGAASCARTVTLGEIAGEAGVAVFTGYASHRVAGGQDLVFVVDRWFHGRHAAREVRIMGSTAGLADAETSGLVAVALAEVVAGDAITLTPHERVLIVAEWVPADRAFGVRFCTVAGVVLASSEGQAALAEATAVFGRGRTSGELPDTGTLPLPAGDAASSSTVLADWTLPLLALVLGASIVLATRRMRARGASRQAAPSPDHQPVLRRRPPR